MKGKGYYKSYQKPGILLEEKTDAAEAAGAVIGIILAIIMPTASDKRLNSELVEEYKEAIERLATSLPGEF